MALIAGIDVMNYQRAQTLAKDARILALLMSKRYEALPIGEILTHRSHGHIGKTSVMKPHLNGRGYAAISLVDDSGVMTCLIHRIVALGLIFNPLNLPEVNHKDGNKSNNAVLNLEWSTSKDNTAHAERTGLRINKAKGNKLPQSKLTDEMARLLKDKIAEGFRMSDLAKEFGIANATVCAIRDKKTWRHV